MKTRRYGAPAILAAGCIVLAACWPFDYSEDYAAPPAATTGAGGEGGTGGARGEGGADPVTDLYVDPVFGKDPILATDSGGTLEKPFKTLKRALSVAVAGQTVHLFSGTYSADSGEDFATPVPDGVTIAALSSGDAILAGTGTETALTFLGGGTVRGVRIEGFGTGVRAGDGAVSLTDSFLLGDVIPVHLTGSSAGTIADSVIAGGWLAALYDTASLAVSGGEIDLSGAGCAAVASIWGASRLTLDGVVVLVAGVLHLHDAARVSITDSSIVDLGCARTISLYDASRLDLEATAMENAPWDGTSWITLIDVDASASVSVIGGSLEAAYNAIEGGKSVTVDGTNISGAGTGIRMVDSGLVSVRNATIASRYGIYSVGYVTVRNSVFDDNTIGIEILGGGLDMGTVADAGMNQLSSTTGTALRISSTNIMTHQAVGNTWIPYSQGANGAGQYPLGSTKIGPYGANDPTPRNVHILGAGPSVQLAVDILP